MTQKKSLNKYSLAAEDALRAKAVQTKTVTETDSKMMKKKDDPHKEDDFDQAEAKINTSDR